MRRELIVLGSLFLACFCARSGAAQNRSGDDAPTTVDADQGAPPAPDGPRKWVDRAERILGRDGDVPTNGFFLQTGSLVTGAGLTAGVGYRRWLRPSTMLVDASAVYSWRGYRGTQARIEQSSLLDNRLTLGAQYRWQDLVQVEYFGQGPDSREADRSEYRLTSHNVVGYANVRVTRHVSARARTGWLHRPTLRAPSGHFQRGFPSSLDVFADDAAVARPQQPHYRHHDVSILRDTRDHPGYSTRGGLARVAWLRFDASDGGRSSFQRFELEGMQFRPMAFRRAVLVGRGWLAMTDVDAHQMVPFYLLPSLGGNNTVRAFHNFRFHDRHMVVVNGELRVPMAARLDAAVFIDAGNVAPSLRSLNLDRASVGVGLRLHTAQVSWARLDVAASREGWRIVFTRSDPLNPARWARRTAPVPFVP